MQSESDGTLEPETNGFSDEELQNLLISEPDVTYRLVPSGEVADEEGPRPVWRVRFDLASDPGVRFGLDVRGEVVLGRGEDAPDFVTLNPYGAEKLGVSRRHLMLRPTEAKLFALDLGSRNGTWRNSRSIGVNTPYSLHDGDLLTIGRLEFVVRIVKRPLGHTAALRSKADLADALTEIGKAITSQLDLDEVLSQALEMAMALTSADEATVWLVDEQTGELFLEAERGIEDEAIRRMRLPVMDTLAGQVVETGKPLRASRLPKGEPIKVKTGYLVEAVMYAPLDLGGVTFGVLAAAHRKAGNSFSEQDERLMAAIADFAAIAVQNARFYQAADSALARRVNEMSALNHALAHDLRNLLNSVIGYAGLLEISNSLDEETAQMAHGVVAAANGMARLIDQLLEITMLSETSQIDHAPCHLLDAVAQAVGDMKGAAATKTIDLDFELLGTPYMIQGDAERLYRSVLNLVDNAVKYSPQGAQVRVTLSFGDNDVLIRVRDTGPGIPESDLPHIFDRYFRGAQASGGKAGIGLGLALVRATVEAHRGTVIARNAEEGSGADFIITLPGTLRVA